MMSGDARRDADTAVGDRTSGTGAAGTGAAGAEAATEPPESVLRRLTQRMRHVYHTRVRTTTIVLIVVWFALLAVYGFTSNHYDPPAEQQAPVPTGQVDSGEQSYAPATTESSSTAPSTTRSTESSASSESATDSPSESSSITGRTIPGLPNVTVPSIPGLPDLSQTTPDTSESPTTTR